MHNDSTSALHSLTFGAREVVDGFQPRIDCHVHTNWTDGSASVDECHKAAVRRKLTSMLFSEHSRASSVGWFAKFADEVRQLDPNDCRAFVGTEVKVKDYDGEIDTTGEIIEICDIVMVSVHRFVDSEGLPIEFRSVDPDVVLGMEKKLALAAIRNPATQILGHLFGMSIRRHGQIPTEDDLREVIAEAAKFDVAIEINSHYHPNPLEILAICNDEGARVSFGSNSHDLASIGNSVAFLG